ncbi:MAG: exopolysaccharide biosynthesis polyprenyl glycosylphosphotransferase [Lachnospiraceae bacterium]|nr:exopolysaccharide biosynthesis polyprenyl glycosylphosphotransferase [Candidatus Merdinaster equi]
MTQKKSDSAKRLIIALITIIEFFALTAAYAVGWFQVYYPKIRYSNINGGLKFYLNGHLLILAIYLVLLMFFAATYGGTKIGYHKVGDVFFSQVFALLFVNFISYLQISLMANWMQDVVPLLAVFGVQLAVALVFVLLNNKLYHVMFPPRRILLVYGSRGYGDIENKINSRKDRFKITGTIDVSEGLTVVEKRAESGEFDAVVLWDIPSADKNRLMKYCYARRIRIYFMPKIPDVLAKGADQLDLFDTPIFLVREYALTIQQRFFKRLVDIICSFILIIITSPFMLITAILVKCYDKGPVLYKQVRCTIGEKEFKILKFRSMRVDAEKDGVARLAAKNDSRITPIGKFIRKVRLDELPQLINILKGDMSFIGPRPERPEIIAQYKEDMPEFAFRMKVKAGLAGFAQVYGKYNTTPYDKLKLDLTYIENYSLWLDLKLMLLTLKILFVPDSTEGIDENQTTALKKQLEEQEEDKRK